MRTRRCSRRAALHALGLPLLAALLQGCDGPDRSGTTAPREAASPAPAGDEDEVRIVRSLDLEVPDEELVDHDGAPVRLRRLMVGRVVAINFVFTTCTTICSPMTAVFAQLQRELGAAMEDRVRLVSISLDPETDTPDRLKAYADRFDRRAGWSFLTGPSERVTRVLKALGGFAAAKERHRPVTLLGSADGQRWTRVFGIAPPRRLAEEVRVLLGQAGASPTSGPRSGPPT